MILIFLVFFLNMFGSNNENTRRLEIYCGEAKVFEHTIYHEPCVHYYSTDAIASYFYLSPIDFIRASIYPMIEDHGKKEICGTKVEIVKYIPKTTLRKNIESFLGFIGISFVSLSLAISLSVSLQKNSIENKNTKNSDIKKIKVNQRSLMYCMSY